jgi:hypothetical protein
MALPVCPNCGAIQRPYGPRGYDGPSEYMCQAQTADDCHVEICTDCAGFYEPDADIDHEGYHVDRSTIRCKPCEEFRQAKRLDNSAYERNA